MRLNKKIYLLGKNILTNIKLIFNLGMVELFPSSPIMAQWWSFFHQGSMV
tara:strand:- start:28 stop:177 length:150 start_codon:yes stop_codon:yes gene_type:complete